MLIKINLQIFLFIMIFALTHQIKIYTFVMIFALVHELGHLIAGMILKLKPKSLNLMPFGISLTFEAYGYKKLIEIKKILIAVAGPLTNLIICAITLFLHIKMEMKQVIIYSNLLIALFNLIPIYPLDGGRILKNIFRLKYDEIKSDRIINKVSNALIVFATAVCSIGILYLKNLAILFVLVYLWIVVINENKKYNIKVKVYNSLQKTNKCIDN